MQTPAGVEMREGMIHVTSWAEAIFNPSFFYRFAHMGLASFLTGGFVVAGVSALYILRGHAVETSLKALKMSLVLLAVIAPMQLLVGDAHGLDTLKHQPAKVAAMEGAWTTQSGLPLLLFAIPDQAAQTNHFEIGIPKLASLILTHSTEGTVTGLDAFPRDKQPPVFMVFWSFRVMVGIGMLMILVGIWGALKVWRGTLLDSRRYLRLLTFMIPAPFVAVLAGWFVTEIGRQPYLIYGMMTGAEGLTPSLQGWMALLTLIGYVAVYAVVFTAGVYYLRKLVNAGISDIEPTGSDTGRPKRPMSAADGTSTPSAPAFFNA